MGTKEQMGIVGRTFCLLKSIEQYLSEKLISVLHLSSQK